MAKGKKSVFFCQNCGHEEAKWLGQCPGCGEWNTFVEEKIGSGVTKGSTQGAKAVRELVREAKVIPLNDVTAEDDVRCATGIKELDRVLGGGIVPGLARSGASHRGHPGAVGGARHRGGVRGHGHLDAPCAGVRDDERGHGGIESLRE